VVGSGCSKRVIQSGVIDYSYTTGAKPECDTLGNEIYDS